MRPRTEDSSAASPWHYNSALLAQAICMIKRLLAEAHPDFVYARAVGPHVRHIIEHYQALLTALSTPLHCVDYDARRRDMNMQVDPIETLAVLQRLIETLHSCGTNKGGDLSVPLTTRLQAGLQGELEVTVPTTLGRELLFLASHTVHHYALLGQYCRAAGVELGPHFGVSPSTIAFQQRRVTVDRYACA